MLTIYRLLHQFTTRKLQAYEIALKLTDTELNAKVERFLHEQA